MCVFFIAKLHYRCGDKTYFTKTYILHAKHHKFLTGNRNNGKELAGKEVAESRFFICAG
jgi:hypothetical protein